MAKGMTKTALVRHMAEKLEITNKQAAAGLELLADTAVKETKKNGEFTIPGIGKLVKAERKARLGRNPQTGETIKIKAKTVVKFRVAKVAKDTIAPPKEVATTVALPRTEVSRRVDADASLKQVARLAYGHRRAAGYHSSEAISLEETHAPPATHPAR